MKKTLKVFAIVACALGMLFTSCSQPQTPSNIEVVTVDATEITVKALPGYNKVTWTPVSNAEYVLYVNGEKKRAYKSNEALSCLDDKIVDGKEYTYTVYTIPAGLKVVSEFNEKNIETIGGNKVAYYTKGNKSSATVKAIVPPFVKDGKLVTALDVIDYDPEAKAEDKVTAENINFFYDEDENSVKFSYPVKDYLTYTYKLYRGNELEVFGKNANPVEQGTNLGKHFGKKVELTTAGEYTLVVEVTCDGYKTSKITAAKKVTVDALDAPDPTSEPNAYYIDEGKKARIIWKPAKKADKSDWDPKNYTVYVKVKDNKNVYTPINLVKSTTVGEDGAEITKEEIKTLEGTQKGDKVYYVEYDVTNNKVGYTFYVVLNDNGKLEEAKKEAKLNAYAEITDVVSFNASANVSVSWTATDKTAKTDDAVLTIKGLSDDQEIEFVKYKVLSKKANGTYTVEQALLDSEFVDAKVPEKYTKNDIIVKDIAEDSKVVFLYAIKEKGKKSFYEFKELSLGGLSDSTDATISCEKEKGTDPTKDPTYLVKFSSDNYDDANNWTYKVYYAKLDPNNATLDGVSSWTSIGDINPKLNESKTAWEAEVKGITLAATTEIKDPLTNKTTLYKDTYAFKIVKTSKVIDYTITTYSNEFENIIVTKTVAK